MASRLLLAIAIALAVMLAICSAVMYALTTRALREQYQSGAQESLRQISVAVDNFALDTEDLLLLMHFDAAVSKVSDVPSNLFAQIGARREFIEFIKSQNVFHRNLYAVMIIDENGRMFGASATRTYDVPDVGESDAYGIYTSIQDHRFHWFGGYADMDFSIIRNPVYVTENEVPVIICARRAVEQFSASNRNSILLCVRKSALVDLFAAFSLPYQELCLLDENGVQLWGSNAERDGLSPAYLADFPAGASSAEIHLNGVDMHAVWTSVGNRGWRIVSMIPQSYYTESMRPAMMSVLSIVLITFTVLIFICAGIIAKQIKPLVSMSRIMQQVGGGALTVRMPEDASAYECAVIARRFNDMMTSIQSLIERSKQSEIEKRTLELEVLQAQINPHFLLNTLLSISWIAGMTNAHSVSASLRHMCRLIEPLYSDLKALWTLRQECDFLQDYVALMGMRFGDKADRKSTRLNSSY